MKTNPDDDIMMATQQKAFAKALKEGFNTTDWWSRNGQLLYQHDWRHSTGGQMLIQNLWWTKTIDMMITTFKEISSN